MTTIQIDRALLEHVCRDLAKGHVAMKAILPLLVDSVQIQLTRFAISNANDNLVAIRAILASTGESA